MSLLLINSPSFPLALVVIFGIIWLLLSAFVLIYLRHYLLQCFNKQLPPIFEAEREDALEAGDVWWKKQFYSRKPD